MIFRYSFQGWGGALVGIFLLAGSAQASESVCNRRTSSADLERAILDPSLRMGFANKGGLFDQGVCWWHSRLQRAVWSLADFRPELSKPTRSEAIRLIRNLASRVRVVRIPGYSNFIQFSRDFQNEIQAELDRWQIKDGFILQSWVRGLSGRSHFERNPNRLARRMEKIYRHYSEAKKENEIPWLMLQMPGIEAHSALLVNMQKTGSGYDLYVVDSNYPTQTLVWKYRSGDAALDTPYGGVVPYLGFHRDSRRMARAVSRHCGTPDRDSILEEEVLE